MKKRLSWVLILAVGGSWSLMSCAEPVPESPEPTAVELADSALAAAYQQLQDYGAVPKVSPIWAVHDHLRHVPPKVREFVRFLSTSFKSSRVAS